MGGALKMIRPFTTLSNDQLKGLVETLRQDENWGIDLTQRVRNYAKRIGEYKGPASYLDLCKLILEEAAYRWVEQNMSAKELLGGKELVRNISFLFPFWSL